MSLKYSTSDTNPWKYTAYTDQNSLFNLLNSVCNIWFRLRSRPLSLELEESALAYTTLDSLVFECSLYGVGFFCMIFPPEYFVLQLSFHSCENTLKSSCKVRMCKVPTHSWSLSSTMQRNANSMIMNTIIVSFVLLMCKVTRRRKNVFYASKASDAKCSKNIDFFISLYSFIHFFLCTLLFTVALYIVLRLDNL